MEEESRNTLSAYEEEIENWTFVNSEDTQSQVSSDDCSEHESDSGSSIVVIDSLSQKEHIDEEQNCSESCDTITSGNGNPTEISGGDDQLAQENPSPLDDCHPSSTELAPSLPKSSDTTLNISMPCSSQQVDGGYCEEAITSGAANQQLDLSAGQSCGEVLEDLPLLAHNTVVPVEESNCSEQEEGSKPSVSIVLTDLGQSCEGTILQHTCQALTNMDGFKGEFETAQFSQAEGCIEARNDVHCASHDDEIPLIPTGIVFWRITTEHL